METSKRLQTSLKTQHGTFHQVVAVSQEALNDGLHHLFGKFQDLRTISISNFAGTLKADMDSAEISLPVKTPNYRTVVFYCRFKSGALKLKNDNNVLGTSIDVAKWRFAFNVDYTTLDVPSTTSEHNEVKQNLNQLGDYSIRRLFLDFKTHKINSFQEDLSYFGEHEWKGDDKMKFQSVMSAWGKTNGETTSQQKWTLGYYLTTQKPETVNPPAPTFPPTAMKHQLYKYIAPGRNEPDEGLENGKNNMLLYLEMTQKAHFPSEDILEYSGNFVGAGMKGSACISRNIFWDAYLLRNPPLDFSSGTPPLLREFNRGLYAWLAELHAWAKGWASDVQWKNGFGKAGGKEESHPPSYFAWEKSSPTEWKFVKSHEMNATDKGTFPVWVEAKASAETHNKMWFTPGDNKINLKGHSKLWVWFKKHTIPNHLEEGWVTIDWETTIAINSVVDGGLEMTLRLPSNPTDLFKINIGPTFFIAEAEDQPKPYGSISVKTIRQAAEMATKDLDFDKIRANLKNALKTSARFVLPGGHDFFYKNPIFNENGDLLVEARYKS